MCKCKNIRLGDVEHLIRLYPPSWSSKTFIDVDSCLVGEILWLWKQGVITEGCCCGHNIKDLPAMINVADESHDKMVELGYIWKMNKHGAIDYVPKTNLNNK